LFLTSNFLKTDCIHLSIFGKISGVTFTEVDNNDFKIGKRAEHEKVLEVPYYSK